MGKILVIAEKPSVARDIAKVLQAKQEGEGCLIGERYVVSWAVGHLVTLAEPEEYDEKYKKWNFSTLPILPEEMQLKAIKQTRDQLKILHSWMHKREIDSLICATDSGREGELIFRYIYEITKCKKPFQRLWISSMTEEAIKEGFATLKDGREYDLLYTSAKCRSEADWLVGMNATRAYTLQYHALLSIGRVQTPTLALIVERQKEIDAFTRELTSNTKMEDIKLQPAIAATREAYKRCGKDPGRYRPSAEALRRRLMRGIPLYQIDTLVDLINLVSLRTGYSIGGFDADKIQGKTLELGIGKSGEPFEGIGRGILNIEGLPVYRDEIGGIGTPTSDNERTKMGLDTTHILAIVNGYSGKAGLSETAAMIQDLLRKYAGSDGGEVFFFE